MLKRVIVKQQDQKDCGVCCLESVIKYYEGYVPLEKIRGDTFTTKRGTSAYYMVETLKKYGFDAYGTKIHKDKFWTESFPLPAIVHVILDNGSNHYMVLYEKRKEKVILMDPNSGKKVMSITDFFWIWSEVAIIMYPKNKIVCYPKEKGFLFLTAHYLGDEKKSWLQMIITNALLFMLTIIGTFFMKIEMQFLNRYREQYIIGFVFFGLLFFRVLGYKDLLNRQRQINKRLELQHVYDYLEHVINLPLSVFKTRNLSDYFTRLWENFDIKLLYTEVLQNFLLSLIIVFFCFFFLYFLSKTFLLFYVVIFLFVFIIHYVVQKKSEMLEKEFLERKRIFSDQMINMIDNNEMLTYLNGKTWQKQKMEEDIISFLRKKEEREFFYQKYNCFQMVLKETQNFIFIVLAIILLTKEKCSLVDLFLIESIGMYLMNALENIMTTFPKFRYLKIILPKENEFLGIEEEKNNKENDRIMKGDLELDNVSFSYNQYNYILKDLKFKIASGKHILMIGKSGCGKSTLCKILTGILKPDYGAIKLGEYDLRDMDGETIRSHIMYLSQRSSLINGTLRDNILLHRPFDESKFQKVCEICHINEIADKRPLRYETVISNQENNLSGGEKQRIMLARTLLCDAQVYLFDESLSEVDEKLEKEIIKNLHKFLKGKIIIYISHRNYKTLFDEVMKLEECHERVFI